MYQRPKLNETEEDLLRQQEEFLKTLGKQQHEEAIAPYEEIKNKDKIPKDIVGNIVGDIIEKNQYSLKNGDVDAQTGEEFPKPFQIDPALHSFKKERKSLFAQHLEKRNKKPSAKSSGSEAKPMDLGADNDSLSHFKDDKSFILTGCEANTIHQENMKMLSQMSEEEILEEQRKLKELLNPDLLQFLKSRRQNVHDRDKKTEKKLDLDEKQCDNDKSYTVLLNDSDELNLDPKVKEQLIKYVDEKWINMDFIEKEKLEWVGDIPDSKTLEPDQPYSARFDFKGELQPFSADIDVTKSLHHHGDEPERPGYTIQELYQLSRSSVLQQRNLALSTLANIIQKTKLGYYDTCFDGTLLCKLVESDLFFLLRFSIDENSLIPVTINCLRRLLCSDTDEFALDKLLGINDIDEQPLFYIEMETNADEEKELKDHVLISCDLVRGVLRTDLLVRLGYLLNHLNPSRETVINTVVSLIRIARHSLKAAQEIIEVPGLLNFVYDCIESSNPIHQGVKLFRILVSHSRDCAREIYRRFSLNFLMSFVDAENISGLSKSEFYLLKLESIYLWRSLLHFDLMIDDFLAWAPCFIRLLRFYIEKVNINSNSDFDFELFSAMSSLFITCVRKKIHLDSNFMIMMYVCLEKWLKQLMQFNEYNFSGSKAIGRLFGFFIAYFDAFGVNESNIQFIKKINSIITSLICSNIFNTMALNLMFDSHVLSFRKIKRDPKNLPSLDSIYEEGNDYLKIIRNSSALPFFISLAAYLKSSYSISHEWLSVVKLFTDCPNIRKYVEKILNYEIDEWNWFLRFENMFLVNFLDLLLITEDDHVLKLAFKLLSMSRTDDKDSERILSVIFNQRAWRTYDLEFFRQLFNLYSDLFLKIPLEKPVMVNYKSEIMPDDWIYRAVPVLKGTENLYNVRNTLKFISLILKEKQTLLNRIPHTFRYYHLSTVFLTDANLFDPEIQKYLKINFEDIILNRLKINLNKKVSEKKSFYDLYTELITQYAGLSYGEPLFAQFVLFPLQNRFDISFRKLLWSEYLHVLRVITIGYPVLNFIDITGFVEPCETDESLLVTYFNCISNKVILKTRNPFVYAIAVNNIKNYLRSSGTNEKLFNFLKNKIDHLPDENLKADFV